MTDSRQMFIDAVCADLVGPAGGPRELLVRERPSDRYLTGILYPEQADDMHAEVSAEDDDEGDDASDDESGPDVPVPMNAMRRPSSMGVSFALHGRRIRLEGSAGRYLQRWSDGAGLTSSTGDRGDERWIREPLTFSIEVELEEGLRRHEVADGLRWWTRAVSAGENLQVTVVLENTRPSVQGRVELEASAFFQASFRVRAGAGSELVPRRPLHGRGSAHGDDDLASSNLIYRRMEEWAVGHTCAATWGTDDAGRFVEATWVPTQHVPSMSAEGHEYFGVESTRASGSPQGAFLASALASATPDALIAMLEVVPGAYLRWIAERERDAGELDAGYRAQARLHLDEARVMAGRMTACIDLLRRDDAARRAFQLGQQAMLIQRRWGSGKDGEELRWRPFQLAFQLLGIPGLVEPSREGRATPERLTMDLLWFPTGGGKTEAYLGLIAFLLIHRRLRQGPSPDEGGRDRGHALHAAAIDRAAVRARLEDGAGLRASSREATRRGDSSLGTVPFGIGLWVGAGATPNSLKEARSSADEGLKARQLTRCPACRDRGLSLGPGRLGPRLPGGMRQQGMRAVWRAAAGVHHRRGRLCEASGAAHRHGGQVRPGRPQSRHGRTARPGRAASGPDPPGRAAPHFGPAGHHRRALRGRDRPDLLAGWHPAQGHRQHGHDPARAGAGSRAVRPRGCTVPSARDRLGGLVLRGQGRHGARSRLRRRDHDRPKPQVHAAGGLRGRDAASGPDGGAAHHRRGARPVLDAGRILQLDARAGRCARHDAGRRERQHIRLCALPRRRGAAEDRRARSS
jgi:hypothetical protein